VIKINDVGADPAPHQKLPGLGPDETSGSATVELETFVKINGVRAFYTIGFRSSTL
jgi:hypothetical protein